jgi:predicted amidohydrolase YtcJ
MPCNCKLMITATSALILTAASAMAAKTADTAFTGRKVCTLNEKQPWAEAVAVKDNKIVYVDDAVGVEGFVGDDTDVIDASGKSIMY